MEALAVGASTSTDVIQIIVPHRNTVAFDLPNI